MGEQRASAEELSDDVLEFIWRYLREKLKVELSPRQRFMIRLLGEGHGLVAAGIDKNSYESFVFDLAGVAPGTPSSEGWFLVAQKLPRRRLLGFEVRLDYDIPPGEIRVVNRVSGRTVYGINPRAGLPEPVICGS